MNTSRGFGVIELLLVLLVALGLGYFFLKSRQHPSSDLRKPMKSAGVPESVDATPKAVLDEVQKSVDDAAKRHIEDVDIK